MRAGLIGWFRTLLLLSLVCALLVIPESAIADRGVGVNVGALDVESRLERGRGYYLPQIGVINTGDVVTAYAMTIDYLADQQEERPKEAWFSFDPQRFTLQPGESRSVEVGVTVPTGADPGDYFALVKAQTVSDDVGETRVGIAAATKLSFSVEPGSWLEAQQHRVNRWLYESEPWIYLIPAALVLGYVAMKARRLPFRLRIERR